MIKGLFRIVKIIPPLHHKTTTDKKHLDLPYNVETAVTLTNCTDRADQKLLNCGLSLDKKKSIKLTPKIMIAPVLELIHSTRM